MDIRPTGGYPDWSSGVSGAAGFTIPTTLQKTMGWQPNTAPPAQYFNWLHLLTFQWIKYLDESIGLGRFGDASDGSATLSGVTLIARDMFYENLNIAAGGALRSNGFRIFVRGALTTVSGNSGVSADGYDAGFGASYGQGSPSGTVRGGGAGGWAGSGATGIGNATGQPGQTVLLGFGGAGGSGGRNYASMWGGFGGLVTVPTAYLGSPHDLMQAPGYIMGITGGQAVLTAFGGGAGGGGAGGDATNQGGAGGGGGGVLVICARELVLNSATDIHARGGRGADTNEINTGGGGGGGGGVVVLVYRRKNTGISFTGTINCAGGGYGANNGISSATGSSGLPGTFFDLQLTTP